MSYEVRYAAAKRAEEARRDESPERGEWTIRSAMARSLVADEIAENWPEGVTVDNSSEIATYQANRYTSIMEDFNREEG